jgi:hypothetical protein
LDFVRRCICKLPSALRHLAASLKKFEGFAARVDLKQFNKYSASLDVEMISGLFLGWILRINSNFVNDRSWC